MLSPTERQPPNDRDRLQRRSGPTRSRSSRASRGNLPRWFRAPPGRDSSWGDSRPRGSLPRSRRSRTDRTRTQERWCPARKRRPEEPPPAGSSKNCSPCRREKAWEPSRPGSTDRRGSCLPLVLPLGDDPRRRGRAVPTDEAGRTAEPVELGAPWREADAGAAVLDVLATRYPLPADDVGVVALGPIDVQALVAVGPGATGGDRIVGAGRPGAGAAVILRPARNAAVGQGRLVGADDPLRDSVHVLRLLEVGALAGAGAAVPDQPEVGGAAVRREVAGGRQGVVDGAGPAQIRRGGRRTGGDQRAQRQPGELSARRH